MVRLPECIAFVTQRASRQHICMTITLRRADPDDWRIYRELRLQALREEPQAYASTLDRELQLTDQQWRSGLGKAVTVLAFRGEELIGTATGSGRATVT